MDGFMQGLGYWGIDRLDILGWAFGGGQGRIG